MVVVALREKRNSWSKQSGVGQQPIPELHGEFAHDKAKDMTNGKFSSFLQCMWKSRLTFCTLY